MNRQTVTLCMIVRDEESAIGMTIKSVLALVDEVIVVDTGSQDNTRIIAEGYGARVLEMLWADDFAAARNVALAEASSDWILVLDADEQLQPIRPVEFQQLLLERQVAGYRLQIVSPRNELAGHPLRGVAHRSLRSVRLFRRAEEVRYEHPIREQIDPSLDAWAAARSMLISDSPLTIMHEGFRPEKRACKRERNLRILRKEIIAHPDQPYFGYQLGVEELTLQDGEALPVAGLSVACGLLEAAWRRGLTIAGLAICHADGALCAADASNLEALRDDPGAPLLGEIPPLAPGQQPAEDVLDIDALLQHGKRNTA